MIARRLKQEIRLQGIPASPGIAIAEVNLHTPEIDVTRYVIDTRKIEEEVQRVKQAIEECKADILNLKEKIGGKTDEIGADIFEAHILLLEDPLLITEVTSKIRKEKINSEFALLETIEKFKERFEDINDEYIKERKMDIQDVGLRILKKLTKWDEKHKIKKPSLIVAQDLTPSDSAGMDKTFILGFATAVGSRTSHTAILGRSLNIPAVVGIKDIMIYARPGDKMIIDGEEGLVILNPLKRTENRYIKKQFEIEEHRRTLITLKDRGTVTIDGIKIKILANIENPDEIVPSLETGAEGVGLFRTEYLFLDRLDFPKEDEQYREYLKAVKLLKDKPLVIRTIDVGGDKVFKDGEYIREQNPFLGLRAIRFSLFNKDMFITQLRAILRASEHGNVYVMFPMISNIYELQEAKKCLQKAKEELKKETDIKVGIMIEIPAAALLAKHFAKIVDFFSIGTNDLLQYTLAVDRGNEHVAHLYNPLHPANLRLIKETVDAANEAGIEVGICGEMASEIEFIPLLIGLGIREFSVSIASLLEVKNIIMHLDTTTIKNIIPPLLELPSHELVEKKLKKTIGPILKKIGAFD
ncbi:MAG: phosphoenolpyruvate--protein phosphotransferase [Candidatus Hydrogenedentota bacterium]